MYKIEPKDYTKYLRYIDESGCGRVYPCSIAEAVQSGELFINAVSDSRSVLYWHYSGFAFYYGICDACFLEAVYDFMTDKSNTARRRFVLFSDRDFITRFFRTKAGVTVEKRHFFEYHNDAPVIEAALPPGYGLCEITKELLLKINGRITPAFSWDHDDSFLEKGKGYCITNGSHVAAWAFSAAVSSEEIDIGVETDSRYRNLGFAYIVAQRMIQFCLKQHKMPVWACHAGNTASNKLAEKLGFLKVAECDTIKADD